jgi:hypothetical protein
MFWRSLGFRVRTEREVTWPVVEDSRTRVYVLEEFRV